MATFFSEKQITNAKVVGVFMNGEDIHIKSSTISKRESVFKRSNMINWQVMG